jgi:hypothetical protein
LLPLLLKWCGFSQTLSETVCSREEARTAERQEKLRSLAYSDFHRPEIILFGLGPWILRSWATARKAMLGTEHSTVLRESGMPLFLSQINISDLLFALQNVGFYFHRVNFPTSHAASAQIPLVIILQSSSTSLGSLALYRSSIQSVVFTVTNLITTTRMAFQGVFLMGAFCAAMKIQPRLKPVKENTVRYRPLPRGVQIQARYAITKFSILVHLLTSWQQLVIHVSRKQRAFFKRHQFQS